MVHSEAVISVWLKNTIISMDMHYIHVIQIDSLNGSSAKQKKTKIE